MIIMVRTRGLGHALGRITRKALGREDNRDSNEALHRRRLTTSALVVVVEDAPHLDDATEEVFQQPEEGFPSGPCDTSVLTAYADHVAIIVWNGKKFGRPVAEIEGLVDAIRLSLLITYPLDTGDQGLISTFMERRHKETSSFHFLVGEVTITLDDVASLLHLPIICAFHSFKTLYDDEAVLMVVEMKPKLRHYIVMGHMYNYLGYEIFIIANSATHVHVVFLDAFRDLNQSGSYAWGTTTLVHMYDNLNDACKSSNKQLDGYITLLQCWIYEHFPSIAEVFTNEDYDERSPHDCRWTSTKASMKALSVSTYRKRLDRLTTADVCWIPYGDHRAVREFNLISCFYGHIQWGPIDQRGLCGSLDYMDWFYMILHPFMRPTQPGDPPRHPPVVQDETYIEPNMPQYPVVAAAIEETPAHAVVTYIFILLLMSIAERLERLLNLRIVIEGTKYMMSCKTA
ncbi:Protein MAIN-LIKE 2 [Glycine soja]